MKSGAPLGAVIEWVIHGQKDGVLLMVLLKYGDPSFDRFRFV
jgi:hypothetical protein